MRNAIVYSVLFLALAGFLAAASPARAQGLAEGITAIEGLVGQVDTAQEQLEKVRQIYEEAKQAGNPEEAAKAGEAVAEAEAEVAGAEARLDDARVNALAREAGVDPARVRELRASGKGWGLVAKELGVHPSALGKGRAFKDKDKGKDKGGMMSGDGDGDDDSGSKGKGKPKKDKDKGKGKKDKE